MILREMLLRGFPRCRYWISVGVVFVVVAASGCSGGTKEGVHNLAHAIGMKKASGVAYGLNEGGAAITYRFPAPGDNVLVSDFNHFLAKARLSATTALATIDNRHGFQRVLAPSVVVMTPNDTPTRFRPAEFVVDDWLLGHSLQPSSTLAIAQRLSQELNAASAAAPGAETASLLAARATSGAIAGVFVANIDGPHELRPINNSGRQRPTGRARWLAVAHMLNVLKRKPGHGALVEVAIPGTTSHFAARAAEIYLPPAWFAPSRPALPIVELLHGTPGTPLDWTRFAGADVTSDRYAATHHGVAPVLIMPDINGTFLGDSECTNGTAGNVETYLTADVPRWARTHLRAPKQGRQWAIGGLSEGGTCAIQLALRHASEFPTFLDFGGDEHITRQGGALTLFAGTTAQRRSAIESYDPIALLRRVFRSAGIAGWFEVGSADRSSTASIEALYSQAMRRRLLGHLRLMTDGAHSFQMWQQAFADALPWLSRRLLLSPPNRR